MGNVIYFVTPVPDNELQPELPQVIEELPAPEQPVLGFDADSYAAVDLGSNSFHMMVSRYEHGEFTVLDRQREVVRLAAGLDENNFLSEEVANRALECLSRFGELLRPLRADHIRVVGTNALRRLKSKNAFLARAEEALGHEIEIIAGREEARLIYLGVSKWSTSGDEARLVIDIGGGSTEIIAGRGEVAYCRESLEVGCVVLSKEFFADGVLDKTSFQNAKLAAELAIQPVVEQFRQQGWRQVIGCSGTMKSLAGALIASGWSKDRIHLSGLQNLLQAALDAGHVDKLNIPGLSADRTPVFAGGLAILLALFELLDIKEMSVSDIALREGVLYDLVGRSSSDDIRDTTVSAMLSRWAVDERQGSSVRETAFNLYEQVAASWDIQDGLYQKMLGWAAQLHELGLLISHDGFHKHGAYVAANADMAGFARRDQLLLAALIAGHRRKFPIQEFEQLPASLVTPGKRLGILLRLAVLLNRNRTSLSIETLSLVAEGQQASLRFDKHWLEDHPLTLADLQQEQNWLKAIGIKLNFN